MNRLFSSNILYNKELSFVSMLDYVPFYTIPELLGRRFATH